jgi:dihydroflavonol-4-reductase
MKLFVTGGTGFLGKAVVEALLAAGHTVSAMVRSPGAKLGGATPIEVGFDGDLVRALEGHDAVVHLAGKVSRDPADAAAMHQIHVEATQRLLDAMAKTGVKRLVLASTSGTIAVRDKPSSRPATEADDAAIEVVGRWPYYMSKRLQEQEVLGRHRRGEIDAVILNPSLLLGPGDDRLSSTADVLNLLNGRVPAITDGTVALVDVRDCAPAFAAAVEKGRSGQRYILNGANMKVRTFVERIAVAGDVSAPKIVLPAKWALRTAQIMDGVYGAVRATPPVDVASVDMSTHHWDCDASLAKNELGFTARDPQKTIQDTVAYLEKKGLFRRR